MLHFAQGFHDPSALGMMGQGMAHAGPYTTPAYGGQGQMAPTGAAAYTQGYLPGGQGPGQYHQAPGAGQSQYY